MMKPSLLSAALVSTLILSGAGVASPAPKAPTYEVPVAARLRPFATFGLKNFVHQKSGARIALSYDLPMELVGSAGYRVELTGEDGGSGTVHLAGPKGEATCTEGAADVYRCRVRYKNVEIDPAGVDRAIRAMDPKRASREARIAVAASFSKEPIGVVRYVEAD